MMILMTAGNNSNNSSSNNNNNNNNNNSISIFFVESRSSCLQSKALPKPTSLLGEIVAAVEVYTSAAEDGLGFRVYGFRV